MKQYAAAMPIKYWPKPIKPKKGEKTKPKKIMTTKKLLIPHSLKTHTQLVKRRNTWRLSRCNMGQNLSSRKKGKEKQKSQQKLLS